MNKIAFEGLGWKVVNKQQRSGDKGGMLAAQATKTSSLLKDGFFLQQDENGTDYWQEYVNGAPQGEGTFVPVEAHNVEEGGKYHVVQTQALFDDWATKSGTPYDGNTWAALSKDVLGWEVEVVNIVMDSDWPGYNCNVKVQHTEGGPEITHCIPIRALCTPDEGATALFMGEVGMFILCAELALYPKDGYNDRGKSMQPLVSEFKGLCETLAGQDDLGYMEVADFEEEPEAYNLAPEIQTWCGEATADWAYDNY